MQTIIMCLHLHARNNENIIAKGPITQLEKFVAIYGKQIQTIVGDWWTRESLNIE